MIGFMTGFFGMIFFWIASRYYLIPDGALRKVRMIFYTYLSVYCGVIVMTNIAFRDVAMMREHTQFYGAIPLFLLSIAYGFLLDIKAHKVTSVSVELEDSLGIAGFTMTPQLKIIWANRDSMRAMLGYDDLVGKFLYQLTHEDSDPAIDRIKMFAQSKVVCDNNMKHPLTVKVKMVSADNMTGWYMLVLQHYFVDNEGVILRCGLQNITASVMHEEQLRIIKAAFDIANIGVTISDVATHKIIYVNEYDAEQHGYHPAELVGKDSRIYSAEGIPFLYDKDHQSFGSIEHGYVTVNRLRDGTIAPFFVTSNSMIIEGVIAINVVFCQRIGELYHAEPVILGKHSIIIIAMSTGLVKWGNEHFVVAENTPSCELFIDDACAEFDRQCRDPDETVKFYETIHDHRLLALAAYKGMSYTLFIGKDVEDDRA